MAISQSADTAEKSPNLPPSQAPPHFDKGLQSTNPILARVYRVRIPFWQGFTGVRIPFWQWFTGVGIPFWQGFTEYKSQFGKDLQSTNPILARVYRVQISFWQGFTEYVWRDDFIYVSRVSGYIYISWRTVR